MRRYSFAGMILIASVIASAIGASLAYGQAQLVNPQIFGHGIAGGNFNTLPPTVGTCGSGATVVGSDMAGLITVGTSASNACTLTFGRTWTVAPLCITQTQGGTSATMTTTVSATAIVFGTALADSAVVRYICLGNFNSR